MSDGYRTDLAYIHDVGFGDLARKAAAAVVDLLHQHGLNQGMVVGLGCGSGISAARIVAAGYAVLGVGLSRDLLALARQRVPQAQFRADSLFDVDLPRCVAVTAIGECLSYAFDAANSAEQRRRLFQRVYAALVPGGLFVFDVAVPGRVPGGGPRQSFFEGEDWAVLVTATEDRQQMTRQMTTFRRVGDRYRRDAETHWLHLLDRAATIAQLTAQGFQVQTCAQYGAMPLPQGLVAFVAQKPWT